MLVERVLPPVVALLPRRGMGVAAERTRRGRLGRDAVTPLTIGCAMSDPPAGDGGSAVEPTQADPLPEAVLLDPPDLPKGDRAVPPWMSRAIALAAGWVVLLFAAYWVLGRLRTLLVMVVVAFFLSLAMEPAVDRLAKRGWRRGARPRSCSVACWSSPSSSWPRPGRSSPGRPATSSITHPGTCATSNGSSTTTSASTSTPMPWCVSSGVGTVHSTTTVGSFRARSVSRSPSGGGCSISSPCSSSRST